MQVFSRPEYIDYTNLSKMILAASITESPLYYTGKANGVLVKASLRGNVLKLKGPNFETYIDISNSVTLPPFVLYGEMIKNPVYYRSNKIW